MSTITHLTKNQLPKIEKNSPLNTTCYLCNQKKGIITEEHVIPKVLFRPNNPGHYIKLYACKKCNETKGVNDERITRFLQATSFSKESQAGLQKMITGARKGNGTGLLKSMVKNIESRKIKIYNGQKINDVNVMKINISQINDYFITIAKGLYVRTSLELHDWKKYKIKCQFEQIIQNQKLLHESAFKELQKTSRFTEYWRPYFYYSGDYIENMSFWQLIFYNSYNAYVYFQKK